MKRNLCQGSSSWKLEMLRQRSFPSPTSFQGGGPPWGPGIAVDFFTAPASSRHGRMAWKVLSEMDFQAWFPSPDKLSILGEDRMKIFSVCEVLRHLQLILIIHRFLMCKFIYSLKVMCNLKIDPHGASMVICRHVQSGKKKPWAAFSDSLPQCQPLGKSLFAICLMLHVSHLGLFVGDLAILNDPKHSARKLSSASQHRKATTCLIEKTGVLDVLHSHTA